MPSDSTYIRRGAVALLLCLAAGAAQAQVVVSQVYGGGGNSGSTWTNDFIELRNNGASDVDLSGWSVQYASSSGGTWQVTALSGTIPAGGYFLVQEAAGSGGTTPLPAPDAIGTIAMSGSNGKVALSSTGTAFSGCPSGGDLQDLVGFGSANCYEGSGATPALNNTTAALRKGDGATDTDDNSADFNTGTPDPRNSGAEPPPPPTALTIAQIQGDGLVSPHLDETVVTEGVITALKFNNGFFLQSETPDGDPDTSEGIFVYTGSAPDRFPGDRVRVTAKVQEFTPYSNPNQLSITELGSPTIELLDVSQTLPDPVEIDPADLSPAASPAALEKLEGMRVSVASSRVVGPSGGSIDETDATSSGNGVFYVTLPSVDRPFREPGIGVLDVIPIPPGKDPPRFDTNPERLMVRSWGQVGAQKVDVDDDAQIDGLRGVLDYYDATWALLPDPASGLTVSGGKTPVALPDAAPGDVTIGSFNLLRFFDDVNEQTRGPGQDDAVVLTPQAFQNRLQKTSMAICDYLKAPDILGVVEVEGIDALGALATKVNDTCAAAPAYQPYLVQGNDIGGINVGFLVSARSVGADPRVEVVSVEQVGKDALLQNPDDSTTLLNDRPPLVLHAIVHGAAGSYPVTVIVNHLRSLNGIDDTSPGSSGWPTGGDRVRTKRAMQAAYLAQLVQDLQSNDPSGRIVLVGDFNAFEFNDGYADVMGIIRGDEAPEDQVLTWVQSPVTTPLLDGSALVADPQERYSYSFGGNAQTLDHVLLNQALLADATGIEVGHPRINADFGVDNFGDPAVAVRSSDHDPVRIVIHSGALEAADLRVAVLGTRRWVRADRRVRFRALVHNDGPQDASSAAVAFVFDALVSPDVAAPEGWACAAPVQDADTTTVTCNRASFVSGGDAAFTVEVIPGNAVAGQTLSLGVGASSATADPANGDNQMSGRVFVRPAAGAPVRRTPGIGARPGAAR